jgi:hypothetical protein
MPVVPAFHSAKESTKDAPTREHHGDGACLTARNMTANERREGTGNYQLCYECGDLNTHGG